MPPAFLLCITSVFVEKEVHQTDMNVLRLSLHCYDKDVEHIMCVLPRLFIPFRSLISSGKKGRKNDQRTFELITRSNAEL